jgi:hypothetical protein
MDIIEQKKANPVCPRNFLVSTGSFDKNKTLVLFY